MEIPKMRRLYHIYSSHSLGIIKDEAVKTARAKVPWMPTKKLFSRHSRIVAFKTPQ